VYQVPNIATYRKFYSEHYLLKTSDTGVIGHYHTDPSGQMAFEFQRKFRIQYDSNGKDQKFDRPVAVLRRIQKDMQGNFLNTNISVGGTGLGRESK
jgi:hypothetical protein